MQWSWKFARLAHIDIRIHATFLIILVFITIKQWQALGTFAAVIDGIIFISALFFCIVLHELGHALMARRFGIPTRDITLYPIGGIAALERMPEKPSEEILVALAGPAVNVIIAGILYFYLDISETALSLEDPNIQRSTLIEQLLIVNIFLAIFNLLPAFPMDGGRVLRAALAIRMEHSQATDKAATVGQTFAALFAVYGVISQNPLLIVIAIFIWVAASAEAGAERIKHSLAGATVKNAMMTNYFILAPNDTLAKAIEYTLAGNQTDFPVALDNRTNNTTIEKTGGVIKFSGILTQAAMLQGLQEHGANYQIKHLPLQTIQAVHMNTPLLALMEQIQLHPTLLLAVTDGRDIVGLVDFKNILELVKIQDSLGKETKPSTVA